MNYRDESETLRARIASLEGELADAKTKIARLTGDGDAGTSRDLPAASAVVESARPSRLLGVVPRLVVRREIAGEADDKGLLAISKLLPARLGSHGQVTTVGRALTYRVGTLEFTLTPTPTGTHLQLIVNHSAVAVMPFVIGLVAAFTVMPFVGATLAPSPLLPVLLLVAGLVGTVLGRALIRHQLLNYQARCRGTVEAVATIIEENTARKMRIAVEPEPEAEREQEEEALPREVRL